MISTHLSKNILIFLTMKINNNRMEISLINLRILYSFIRILDLENRITQTENTHNFVGGGDFMILARCEKLSLFYSMVELIHLRYIASSAEPNLITHNFVPHEMFWLIPYPEDL